MSKVTIGKQLKRIFKSYPKIRVISNDKNKHIYVKLRDYCNFCKIDIKPHRLSLCRYCRKTFCDDHINAFNHKCKKIVSGRYPEGRPTTESLKYLGKR